MTPTSTELLQWPDRRRRIEKQRWREVLELLERAATQARSTIGRGRPRLAIATPVHGLAEALGARTGLTFSTIDHASASGQAARHETQHIVLVTHPEVLGPAKRMELLRRCIRATRPAGQLVIVANVVGEPKVQDDGTRVAVLTCKALLGQLETASAQGLTLEDLRSVRWGDEPVHRGVVLTMTRISTPIGW